MKRLTFLTLTLFYINCYSQQFSKCWKDLNYLSNPLVYHRLDIYLPKIEKPKYPVVVSMYGSAWFANNAKGTDLRTIGKAVLDAGFAVVTPGHRSSVDAKLPAQMHEIKAAVRFIRAQVAQYHMDTCSCFAEIQSA
jgi:acetyl esterase/lipase